MKFAAHTDGLVLGIGDTSADAIADAVARGAEEDLLEDCEITDRAAEYAVLGGDCRALTLIETKGGVYRFIIDADEPLT